MYVDKQRNVAVALGERDVKADVTAKNRYMSLMIRERGTSKQTSRLRTGTCRWR